MLYFTNFLSEKECKEIIKLGQTSIKPSMVDENATNGKVKTKMSPSRTSSTMFFTGRQVKEGVLLNVSQRAAALSHLPESHNEIQYLSYDPGQEFKVHYDGEQRRYSCLLYLCDLDEDETGGCTSFPKLNLRVRPQAGACLFWRNTLITDAERRVVAAPAQSTCQTRQGRTRQRGRGKGGDTGGGEREQMRSQPQVDRELRDTRMLHCGEPCVTSKKHAVNLWVHPDPQEYLLP